MQVVIHTFDLRLRHRFTISRESTTSQETLIVELTDGVRRGFGEATTNTYYGYTLDNMRQAIDSVRPILEAGEWSNPTELWSSLSQPLADNPFALCAIDQAAYDLWGKQQGQPVYKLWGLTTENNPVTDYTIGIDDVDVMVAKMNEFPGWPVYKVKLGTDNDLEIIRRLREHTEATFRVDANCAWSADETIHNAAAMKDLGVEFIEQPMQADQWDAMRQVVSESALPIIADESCIVEADVARCAGHFNGVNIKLVKCGGLTPARRMIAEARSLGLQVMVGCMTESTVGISAIAQLLPLLDYVDMDGALLLADDVADGVTIDQGVCHYPDTPGSGILFRGM